MLALEIFAPRFAAETAPTILLALALLTVVFGIGVVVFSRRRSTSVDAAPNDVVKVATEPHDVAAPDVAVPVVEPLATAPSMRRRRFEIVLVKFVRRLRVH
jgi:hypothetical protein